MEAPKNKANIKITPKILVVDDELLNRKCMKNMLKSINSELNIEFQIIEGSDGNDILNFLSSDWDNDIKIIFTDENMEFTKGSQAIKFLRQFEENNNKENITIISMTSCADDEEIVNNIIDCGADYVIMKPVSKEKIRNFIKKIISN